MKQTPPQHSNLSTWLSYIEQQHPIEIDLGLERAQQVWLNLNVQLPGTIITVGGTNGKGSTCAMLHHIYQANGYQVASYNSPHLVDFNERAKINENYIDDQALIKAFEIVEAARGDTTLTYFEFTTLAILYHFSQLTLDVIILEVGLGGRLDTVNIIDADCSIVTNVDLDHQDFLGDTREAIGFEKAHIYRTNRPAICVDPTPPASLINYANTIQADLWCFGKDFNYFGDKQQWSYVGRTTQRHALAYPGLRGMNQLLNASGALAAIEALSQRIPVTQQAIRQGLLNATVPGRFQLLPGKPSVVLDVAHNPHAASVLNHNLDQIGFAHTRYAIIGMMADKDIINTIQPLLHQFDAWLCVDLPTPRAIKADDLKKILDELTKDATKSQIFASPRLAYQAIMPTLKENDRIVVFGSFFTVADVLAFRQQINAPQ